MLDIKGYHIIIIIGGIFSRIISCTPCLLTDITSLSSKSVNSTKPWTNCFLLDDRESVAAYTTYLLAMLLLLPLSILAMEVSKHHHHGCSRGRAHPHGPSGAAGLGRSLFRQLHLQRTEATEGRRCSKACVLRWNWTVSLPHPGLPGPLPGCCPSNQVNVDAAVSWDPVEESQHWLRLAALPPSLDGKATHHPHLHFSHPLHLSVLFLWNPLRFLCRQSLWAKGRAGTKWTHWTPA